MKKRLLSLLLAVCMVAALFAGLGTTASAYVDNGVSGYLVPYTFQAGDTIYGVCQTRKIDFATNLELIGKINSITNYNYMMPGKQLWLPSTSFSTDEAHYTLHKFTVTAGDTLAAISQTYGGFDYNRDYQILAALNNNLNMLMVGQTLIIPTFVDPKGTTPDDTTPAPAPDDTTPVVPTGDKLSYYLAQHVLQAGETVSGICLDMGVDFMTYSDTIMRINNIASYNYMLAGQVLLIPSVKVPSGSYYKVMAHTVVAGDTVYDLCAAYGLNFFTYSDMIARLNNRTDLSTFYVGQTLYMPSYQAAATVPATPAAAPAAAPAAVTPEAAAAAAAAGAATGEIGSITTPGAMNVPAADTLSSLLIPHVLQAGETVSGICADLGVDFLANSDRIMQLNNIASYNYLLPGKLILIPSTVYPSSGPYYKVMAHTLVAGDTVYDLCTAYGLNYNSNITFIQRLNNRDNMATYYVGETVYMPLYVPNT